MLLSHLLHVVWVRRKRNNGWMGAVGSERLENQEIWIQTAVSTPARWMAERETRYRECTPHAKSWYKRKPRSPTTPHLPLNQAVARRSEQTTRGQLLSLILVQAAPGGNQWSPEDVDQQCRLMMRNGVADR